MYMQQLGEIVPPPNQNTVGDCNLIVFLIFYSIISRLVTLLEVNDAPTQAPEIFDPTVQVIQEKNSVSENVLCTR
jgi:hypothetical protein